MEWPDIPKVIRAIEMELESLSDEREELCSLNDIIYQADINHIDDRLWHLSTVLDALQTLDYEIDYGTLNSISI